MLLDLKKIFSGESEGCSFEYPLDLSLIDVNGFFPFVAPVGIRGTVKSMDGSAQLDMEASFEFSIPCDRCTTQIHRHFSYSFSHVLVTSLENEDNDRFVEIRNDKLDLDGLVREDILLELPTKFLCREDCRGLCPICGKNLNEGPCGCKVDSVDPRLEALKNFIQ
jgi:uncharacterized protein